MKSFTRKHSPNLFSTSEGILSLLWRAFLMAFLMTFLVAGLSGCRGGLSRMAPPALEKRPLVIPSQWHHSYESARSESLETGRPILINFTGSDWCHWCVKLKQDVFNQPEFQAWAKDNVILLELDFPKRSAQSPIIKQQNQKLAQQFGVEGYPTVLLVDANGKVMGDSLGYLPEVDRWLMAANSILDPSSVPGGKTRTAEAAPTNGSSNNFR